MSGKFHREYVLQIGSEFVNQLALSEAIARYRFVGKMRRGYRRVDSAEILIEPIDVRLALDVFLKMWGPDEEGWPSRKGLLEEIPFQFHFADVVRFNIELLLKTGSKEFLRGLQGFAAQQAMAIDHEGLKHRDLDIPMATTEETIFKALGLAFIEPSERRTWDESKIQLTRR